MPEDASNDAHQQLVSGLSQISWGGYNRRSAETLGLKEQYQVIDNPGFKELIRSL